MPTAQELKANSEWRIARWHRLVVGPAAMPSKYSSFPSARAFDFAEPWRSASLWHDGGTD